MKPLKRLSVLALIVVSAACANQKAPAEAAVKAAQDAFSAVSADAQKYVPDQARAVQDSLTAAQDALTKGDYTGAMQHAQAIPAKVGDLQSAIAGKKAELAKAWTEMSAGVPQLLAALKSRAEILAKSRKLPAGLTKVAVDGANAGVATASQTWSEAMAAAQSNDMATAAAKATEVKHKVVDLMKSLNMQVPASAM